MADRLGAYPDDVGPAPCQAVKIGNLCWKQDRESTKQHEIPENVTVLRSQRLCRHSSGGVALNVFRSTNILVGDHSGQCNTDGAGRRPKQNLIAQDMPHPASPPDQALRANLENFASMRQRDGLSPHSAGNSPDLRSHTPSFVARIVVESEVTQPACPGNGGKRVECGPTELAVGQSAKLVESGEYLPFCVPAYQEQSDAAHKAQHQDQLGDHDPFQCIVDLATKDQGNE